MARALDSLIDLVHHTNISKRKFRYKAIFNHVTIGSDSLKYDWHEMKRICILI